MGKSPASCRKKTGAVVLDLCRKHGILGRPGIFNVAQESTLQTSGPKLVLNAANNFSARTGQGNGMSRAINPPPMSPGPTGVRRLREAHLFAFGPE